MANKCPPRQDRIVWKSRIHRRGDQKARDRSVWFLTVSKSRQNSYYSTQQSYTHKISLAIDAKNQTLAEF